MPKLTKAKIKYYLTYLIQRAIYIFFYAKKKTLNFYNSLKNSDIKNQYSFHDFYKELLPHGRKFITYIGFFITILLTVMYISALVNFHINKNTEKEIISQQGEPHIITALKILIKSQIDEVAWTPAHSIISPAIILDNQPNFQLGVKDSVLYITQKLAKKYPSSALTNAAELLSYPPHIWLFSQTKDKKFAPGSAKQYRNALAELSKTNKDTLSLSVNDAKYILKTLNRILEKRLNKINQHIREHSTDLVDFKSDDIFYNTEGYIYTVYYTLKAFLKDYQNYIVASEQYENLTTTLNLLKEALEISPITIENASLNDTYKANHLAYLRYYLSETKSLLNTISHNLKEDTYNEN